MTTRFTSIHHPLAIDRGLAALAREDDYAKHVEQLIRQVLFTKPGERVNRPDFGCGIRQLVFAPNSDVAASMAQVTVFQALDRWLASVIQVERVEVKGDDAKLNISITYVLKVRQETRYLNIEVS